MGPKWRYSNRPSMLECCPGTFSDPRQYLRSLVTPVSYWRDPGGQCSAANGFPIIDRLDDELVVGCGFSGSGFKHSPATGRMLAALALGQEESIPEGFRADRYTLNRFDH